MLGLSSWPLKTTQAPHVVEVWVEDSKIVWLVFPWYVGEASSDHKMQLILESALNVAPHIRGNWKEKSSLVGYQLCV